MKYKIYLDPIAIKASIDGGRLDTKIDGLGGIYIEDRIAGEAVKIGQLPSEYSFHSKGHWKPEFVYTSHSIEHPMQGEERWVCSECGWDTDEKHDWCVCGADMRESNKVSSMTKKAVEELLKQL